MKRLIGLLKNTRSLGIVEICGAFAPPSIGGICTMKPHPGDAMHGRWAVEGDEEYGMTTPDNEPPILSWKEGQR